MTKRDVISDILTRLDALIAKGEKLPSTNDGKINVSGLCRMLDLKPSDVQHFHKKEAIKTAVNALASEQGLMEIGARSGLAESDAALKQQAVKTAKKAKEDAQAAVESKAQYAALLDEYRAAHQRIAELERENVSLKEQLALIKEGVMVRL